MKVENGKWEVKKLGEVCEIFTDGNWIESKDQSENGIRLIQTGNIGFGFYKNKLNNARYISEKTFTRLKCTEILPNDLLVSRLPDPVGKSCIIPNINTKMITGVDCTIIRTKNILLSKFLLYFQMSNTYLKDVASRITGTTRSRISRKNLGLIPIPLPPLPEQKRIVAILDKAFSAIDKAKQNTEQNLKNTKELFESYLQNIFDNGKLKIENGEWEEKTLGEVCLIKPPKKEAKEKLKETDFVTFLPMKDLGVLSKEITGSQKKQLKEVSGSYTYFANNDVLLAKITPCFENRKIGIANHLENGIGFGSSEYIVFRPLGELEPSFIYYFLSREVFIKEGRNQMKGAVGHKRVAKEWIENYKISFPSINQQKQIVKKLNALQTETKKLENIYQQKLNDLDELKKSILQKAFRGEL